MRSHDKRSGRPEFSNAVNRRGLLAALSTSAGAALAGCLGDDDDGDDGSGDSDDGDTELGEAVDTFTLGVFSGAGDVQNFSQGATPLIAEDIEEHLGVGTSLDTKDAITLITEFYGDGRESNAMTTVKQMRLDSVDPLVLYLQNTCSSSANGNSQNHLCDCELDELIEQQRREADPEQRSEINQDINARASELVERINLVDRMRWGAYRTDQVDVGDVGQAGIHDVNWQYLKQAETTEADRKVLTTSDTTVTSRNHLTAFTEYFLWSNLVYSPLISIDKNFELGPELAETYEVENDFQRITFELRDDVTFHNGDPITAEDVLWTYEYMQNNFDLMPRVESWEFDSMEQIDDRTVEFTFSDSVPAFLRLHAGIHGILPMDHWVENGAEDSPAEFLPDPIIGSGPYEVVNYSQNELMEMVPFEDHHSPGTEPLTFLAFDDPQSVYLAFQEGDGNIYHSVPQNQAQDIDENMSDVANVEQTNEFFDWWLVSYMNYGPTMFWEFRMALSQAIDRQRINEQVSLGEAEPAVHSSFLGRTHPEYPENPDEVLTRIADSTSSNPEVAQGYLEDAGWGWDEDDNLHYPPNAELDPLWTQEETALDYKEETC